MSDKRQKPGQTPADVAALRKRADEQARNMAPTSLSAQTPEEIQRVIHELRVHQIELEMQNEELRTAQAGIEAGRARYFDLYDLAPVGYCTLSEQGLILDVNLTAATLLGTTRGLLVRQPITRFILKDDQDIYYLHRKKLFETGEPQKCDLRLVKPDGAFFWAHLKGTAAQAEDGAPLCRVVISDITERKRAEAEKAGLEAKVQQLHKAESLGRMAGAIAHHFNNQLFVVMGNLEMVLDDLPDDAENREILFQAFEAGCKATEMSHQMLRYLGHISGRQTTMNLSDVCRQSLTSLQSALPGGVTLNVDFPDSGPFIHADAGQIQQVLTNLLTNAQESVPDNQGIIGLIIRTVSHEDISTSNRFPLDWQPRDIPYACLEISDTGRGISREDIEKVFDPFYTTKFTGRGMGLPVTMGILKTHGGCITVENEPECGCVFRVYLPVSTEKESVKHEKETTSKGNVENGGAVLLIEDEESVRNMEVIEL